MACHIHRVDCLALAERRSKEAHHREDVPKTMVAYGGEAGEGESEGPLTHI